MYKPLKISFPKQNNLFLTSQSITEKSDILSKSYNIIQQKNIYIISRFTEKILFIYLCLFEESGPNSKIKPWNISGKTWTYKDGVLLPKNYKMTLELLVETKNNVDKGKKTWITLDTTIT